MERRHAVISVLVAVPDAPEAVAWYKRALGAVELWDLGAVAGLEIAGAAFFVGQPENNGWESPARLGITTARVEVFCDDPDAFISRAVEAGADGSAATGPDLARAVAARRRLYREDRGRRLTRSPHGGGSYRALLYEARGRRRLLQGGSR